MVATRTANIIGAVVALGAAAGAIGYLLWKHPELFRKDTTKQPPTTTTRTPTGLVTDYIPVTDSPTFAPYETPFPTTTTRTPTGLVPVTDSPTFAPYETPVVPPTEYAPVPRDIAPIPYQGTLEIYTVTTAGGPLPGRSFWLDSDAWRAAEIAWSRQTSDATGSWASTVAEGTYYIYFGGATGQDNLATVKVSPGLTTSINIAFASTAPPVEYPTEWTYGDTTPSPSYNPVIELGLDVAGDLSVNSVDSSGYRLPYRPFMLDSDAWRAVGNAWEYKRTDQNGAWSAPLEPSTYYIYYGDDYAKVATVRLRANYSEAINIVL